MNQDSLFAEDFREEPWWWQAAPRPKTEQAPFPESVDVAVVGSGFTGLSCATTLARGGRNTLVLEAHEPGYGASSRNAGFVGKTCKHSLGSLIESVGEARAVEIYNEHRDAFDYVWEVVEREQMRCHLTRCGRFMATHSRSQYEGMARELELRRKHLGDDFEMLQANDVHRELGSGLYHGGAVVPGLGGIHPGLYHLGLLHAARNAGVGVAGHTPVTGIERGSGGFRVVTSRGTLRARDVVVATNGYTGKATPWFRRRVVPFKAFMVATERLPEETLDRTVVRGRTVHDYNNNLTYLRRAPDEPRLLLGGRTGTQTDDLRGMAAHLHRRLTTVFPDLAGVKLSRVWSGYGAGTFDLYPHIGVHDGVHYAMGYCFAGLPMGTWLGHKLALKILGAGDSRTVFDEMPFQSRAWYWGNPWFMPLVMAKFDHDDRKSMRA